MENKNTKAKILGLVSFGHFTNDTMQSLMIAVYPMLKNDFSLTFAQIGLITLVYQLSASILQPLVGLFTDRYHKPYSIAFSMFCTFIGLTSLAFATNYYLILVSAILIGIGSSIFHPEASRIARMAAFGEKYGLAQSFFQIGGNLGSAIGPLIAVWLVLPNGQSSIFYISIIALLSIPILIYVGSWHKNYHASIKNKTILIKQTLSKQKISFALMILLILMFSKFLYMSGISNYLMFYLIQQYNISDEMAQYHLFYFLLSVALGTIFGGPLGDKFGRKAIIFTSIFGIVPFALALPYVDIYLSTIFLSIIGFMLASAFPAIVVYAQELIPGKVGTISGLFFGIAFGLAGIGAAILGYFIDIYGVVLIYKICSFLPLLGLFAVLLP
ncbi:MFS transporter [Aliarcobacter butzleri]|uniref:MFS transporter n=2 Tax=Aliarcobacter butzleri TaxID=28197 RepID=A0AAW7PZM9_9BACT|nr:MFS transporter [Aliarcobacter butzleri]KLD99343.1 Fosmidomycin resistance protein [Aliarcobacter butzleri L348]MCG3667968.1 MFS transporter [Aliarcobacter butzleri]MDN5071477.1 MFS transporter [Aliarcobacter butzleri]MDN5095416.1 MFS transporter [Aliarcobacter butzleri]